MSNPENQARSRSAADKLFDAAAVFTVTVVLAASASHTETQPQAPKSLVERCQEKYPSFVRDDLSPEDVGFGDYLPVQQIGTDFYPIVDSPSAIEQLIGREAEAYKASPERSRQIEEHVNQFAADMVERANSGDKSYKFYRPGKPGDDYYQGDPNLPVPDHYQGFGWLWRSVSDDNGKIVKQEVADNIYRHSDGTYYAHPHPWTLSVTDKNAQAVFQAPEGLGLVRCASVPGNGATQGWRVSQYDYHHLYEPNFNTMQGETFDDTTRSGVQLVDRRAFHFVDNRYNPDAHQ